MGGQERKKKRDSDHAKERDNIFKVLQLPSLCNFLDGWNSGKIVETIVNLWKDSGCVHGWEEESYE